MKCLALQCVLIIFELCQFAFSSDVAYISCLSILRSCVLVLTNTGLLTKFPFPVGETYIIDKLLAVPMALGVCKLTPLSFCLGHSLLGVFAPNPLYSLLH